MGQRERGDMVRRYGDLQEYARMEETDRGRPDCFAMYLYTLPDLAKSVIKQFDG